MPVPVNATAWGAPAASSPRVKTPLRAPAAVGVKAMRKPHFAPGASVALQVVDTMLKSPLTLADVIFNLASPVFVMVTVLVALVVPIARGAKVSGADIATAGPASPTPDSWTWCGDPGASSVSVNVP